MPHAVIDEHPAVSLLTSPRGSGSQSAGATDPVLEITEADGYATARVGLEPGQVGDDDITGRKVYALGERVRTDDHPHEPAFELLFQNLAEIRLHGSGVISDARHQPFCRVVAPLVRV